MTRAGVRLDDCDRRVRIGLSAPWIDERDEELVLEVLRSGRLSLGPAGPRFEALLADAVGAPLRARGLVAAPRGSTSAWSSPASGPGDEVITSPYSFVASANCAIYEGATPVFADIDPRHAEPRSGRGRGGDHAAHEGGRRRRHLRLSRASSTSCARSATGTGSRCVEDSCEALGAALQGPAARLARPSRHWAFYPNKQITTGEGGAVTTGSAEEHELARLAPQPGPARDVELAPARPARLQLPARRHLGRARDRAARAARPDPRRAARGRGALQRAARGRRRRDAAARTTTTTSARGSSTS